MARRRPEPPLDPFERAARRSDPEYARLAEAADAVPPKSVRAPRLLAYFAVLVAATAIVKGGHGGPALKRSCTQPGFSVATTSVSFDSDLRWTATGPAADAVSLSLDGSPVAGPTALTNCLVHGSFPVQVRTGKHTLTATFTGGTAIAKTLTVR